MESSSDRLLAGLARLADEPAPASAPGLGPKLRRVAGRRDRRRRTLAMATLIAPIGIAVFVAGGRREMAPAPLPATVTRASAAAEEARRELARLDAELARVDQRITRLRLESLGDGGSIGLEPKVALRVHFEGEAARLAAVAEQHAGEPLIAEPLRDAVRRIYPDTSAARQLARAPIPALPPGPNES